MEYKYNKENGEHIDILDNKVSGLKRPLYDAIALRSNIGQIRMKYKRKTGHYIAIILQIQSFSMAEKLMLSGLEN